MPLTYKENVLEVISNEDPGTIIWQTYWQSPRYLYIYQQGSGYDYSRSGIDLYNVFEHNGIDMTDLDQIGHYFDVAWEHTMMQEVILESFLKSLLVLLDTNVADLKATLLEMNRSQKT